MPADALPARPTRRAVLGLGSAAGGILLAGCAAPGDATRRADGPAEGSAAAPSTGSAPGTGATTTVPLAQIPVGGTASATLGGAPVLLARPEEATVVAFSATCPHQGCTVEPAGDEFDCPCHHSRFAAASGDVLGGPAPRGLTRLTATVSGDSVTVTA